MAFILWSTPKHPEEVVGAKGEIPVDSGTLKAMRERKVWWERQDETCRITNSKGQEVS